ncbi:MAG TPA: ABC transporter substrate-binding protein [Stellaceae bacterium]|jgi:4,5-dihydroxyphthalate decarboxylase|nr:ABC transporter substrate-binding protein [Stellaceae bacterium]
MSKPTLTFACGLYDRVLPLYTGEVKPVGLDVNFLAINNPREIFDRMGGGQEFDASEFSSSEFISGLSAGTTPFVALPSFPSRVFRHSMITINKRSGIKSPKDLEGKRVGTPLYTQTAAIFIRGMLQHDHGVDMSKIHFVQGALNHVGSHGQPSAPPLLKKVDIEIADSKKSLSDLIDKGEIDAIFATNLPTSMKHNPDVVRLFPNYREIEKDYYKRTGIFPIMHLVAMRRETYEKYPFAASSLYEALKASRERSLKLMRETGALRFMMPWMTADLDEIDEVFGGDPWPDGIEANRKTLEALVTYLHEQGLIAKKMPIEDIFVKTFESH